MPTIPDDESWAVTEFAEADLADARRTQRLLELATVLAQRPTGFVAGGLWQPCPAQSGVSLF